MVKCVLVFIPGEKVEVRLKIFSNALKMLLRLDWTGH